MRDNSRDKARFPVAPSTNFREVQRLKDEDSVLESSADVRVTGAVPEFIGVPAGIQQFYTAPILANNVINMNKTFYLFNIANGLSPVQDYGNVFGTGSAAIVANSRNASSDVYSYNFVNGVLSSKPMFSHSPISLALSGLRVGQYLAVSDITSFTTSGSTSVANGTVTIPYYKDGGPGVITVSTPSGYSFVSGVGIAENEQDICVVWKKTDNTVKIRTYSTSGTMTGESNEYVIANMQSICFIDKGMIAFPSTFSFKFLKANTSSLNTLVTIPNGHPFPSSLTGVSENFTSDGYYFFVNQSGNFTRYNLNNNTSQVFPNIMTRNYNTSPPTSATIAPYVVVGIDANNFLIGGALEYQGYLYPIYCAVKIVGSTVYISDSYYNAYFGQLGAGSGVGISSVTYTNGGKVVYALYTNAPYDDYLVLVDGPS